MIIILILTIIINIPITTILWSIQTSKPTWAGWHSSRLATLAAVPGCSRSPPVVSTTSSLSGCKKYFLETWLNFYERPVQKQDFLHLLGTCWKARVVSRIINLPVRSRAIAIERVEQVDSKLIGMREMPDISFITQWNSFPSQPEKALPAHEGLWAREEVVDEDHAVISKRLAGEHLPQGDQVWVGHLLPLIHLGNWMLLSTCQN